MDPETPGYYCSDCGVEVEVLRDGQIVRACGHSDSTVTLQMQATAYGVGRLVQ